MIGTAQRNRLAFGFDMQEFIVTHRMGEMAAGAREGFLARDNRRLERTGPLAPEMCV